MRARAHSRRSTEARGSGNSDSDNDVDGGGSSLHARVCARATTHHSKPFAAPPSLLSSLPLAGTGVSDRRRRVAAMAPPANARARACKR